MVIKIRKYGRNRMVVKSKRNTTLWDQTCYLAKAKPFHLFFLIAAMIFAFNAGIEIADWTLSNGLKHIFAAEQ
ncbi:hypothetical protein A8V38_13565 [Vibrio parahaemolyticus]|nr:hypothetical protein [Vibrio parahaemolyticus]